ncbi:MAG: InlB B-repeat-containing protein [bacterium]|nr:InlB B-repeat-containing protein [bacterium]
MAQKKVANNNTNNRTSKNNSKKIIKEEINDEKINIKIIVVSLILALLIGTVVYFNVGKKSDKDIDNNKQSDIEDKIIDDTEDSEVQEEVKDQKSETSNIIKTVMDNSISKEEEKISNENSDDEEKIGDEIKYYSITFNTNGGNNIDRQILENNEVTQSVLPVKEGWSFAGWFTDEDLTNEFVFGDILTEDIVLNAKWVKIIEFVSEDEVLKMVPVSEGETIILPSDEDLSDIIDSENEVATWIFKGLDEYDEEYTLEVLEGMTFDTSKFRSSSSVVKLYMDKLTKFDLNFFLNENSDFPIITLKVVEGRTIDFSSVDEKLNEIDNLPEEYGWYFKNIFGIKVNFDKDKKANSNITNLYLDETYKITYIEKEETDEGITNDVILKEENIVKDSTIEKDDILVPEQKEGYNFEGWILVDDESNEEVYLDEKLIIDEDKIFIADYKEISVKEDLNLLYNEIQEEEEENLEEEFVEVKTEESKEVLEKTE